MTLHSNMSTSFLAENTQRIEKKKRYRTFRLVFFAYCAFPSICKNIGCRLISVSEYRGVGRAAKSGRASPSPTANLSGHVLGSIEADFSNYVKTSTHLQQFQDLQYMIRYAQFCNDPKLKIIDLCSLSQKFGKFSESKCLQKIAEFYRYCKNSNSISVGRLIFQTCPEKNVKQYFES